MRKAKIAEKFPHMVRLPKGSISPTNSIYKEFDIVHQTWALSNFIGSKTIRSRGPFTLTALVNGKVKTFHSFTK